MKTTLSLLVHGESGVGKSWFADTAPYPRLVIDLEGRAQYTPSGPKVFWDPKDPPPVADGTWGTCVVRCPDFDTLQQVYTWLRSGQHQFKSVIIDSVMEAQKRCMDQITGTDAMQTQDWGTLLRKLEALVRSYRDLTMFPSNPIEFVVLIVGTRTNDKSGQKEPLLQGQLRDTVPYYLDVVGYLYMHPLTDPATNMPTNEFCRALLIHKQPGFVAKDGTGKLPGPVVFNPDLSQMYEILQAAGHTAPEAAQEVAS